MAQPRLARCNLSQQLDKSTQPGEYLDVVCGVASCLTLLSENVYCVPVCSVHCSLSRLQAGREQVWKRGSRRPPASEPCPHIADPIAHVRQGPVNTIPNIIITFARQDLAFNDDISIILTKEKNAALQWSLQVVKRAGVWPIRLVPSFPLFPHAPVLIVCLVHVHVHAHAHSPQLHPK